VSTADSVAERSEARAFSTRTLDRRIAYGTDPSILCCAVLCRWRPYDELNTRPARMTLRKACQIATLSAINLMGTALGANSGLSG
jgi:hypothetical protein